MTLCFPRVLNLRVLLAAVPLLLACSPPEDTETSVDPVAAAPATVHANYTAEAFFKTTSFSIAAPSPYAFSAENGDLLVTSDESGVFNAYRVDIASGEKAALSSSQDSPIFRGELVPRG